MNENNLQIFLILEKNNDLMQISLRNHYSIEFIQIAGVILIITI